MALPTTTAHVLEFLGGHRPLVDYVLVDNAGTLSISQWLSQDPQPTEQEINDAAGDLTTVNGQTFSQWLAEHGGDSTATMKRLAKDLLDAQDERFATILRALLIELLNHINTQLAANHNDLLTWLGTQTSLANRVQLTEFAATQPTAVQARTAIKTRITNDEANG